MKSVAPTRHTTLPVETGQWRSPSREFSPPSSLDAAPLLIPILFVTQILHIDPSLVVSLHLLLRSILGNNPLSRK